MKRINVLTGNFAYVIIENNNFIITVEVGENVKTVKIINFEQLNNLIEEVNKNEEEPILITNNDKKAVLLSEQEYRNLTETIYINSNPRLVKSILEADKQPLNECKQYVEGEEW